MKFLKEMLAYTISSVVEKIVPLLLLPVLTRILSPEDYGLISLFMAVVALLVPVVGISLDGFIKVIYHKVDYLQFSLFVRNTITIFLITWLSVFSVGWILDNYLNLNIGGVWYFVYVAILVAGLQFIVSLRLSIYQASRNVKSFVVIQLTRACSDLAFVTLLVILLYKDVESRIVAYMLSFVIVASVSVLTLGRDKMLALTWDKQKIERSLYYSLPLVPHTIALAAVFAFDKILLSAFENGVEVLGYISVAVSLSSPTMLVATAVNRAFLPWALRKFRERRNHEVVAVSYALTVGMFAVCLIYSLLLGFIFDIVVGGEFAGAKIISIMLCWAGFFKLIYYMVAKGILYSEKMNVLPLISMSIGFLYLATLWLLFYLGVSVTGLTVTWLMLAYHISVCIATVVVSHRVFYQPWADVTEVRKALVDYFSRLRR